MNWCTIFKDNFAQQLASFYDHGGRCFKAPDVRWFLLSIWNHFWEIFSLSPSSLLIFHSHSHPQSLKLSRSFSTQPDYLHRSHQLFLLGSLITALHLPLPFLLFLISLTHTPSHTDTLSLTPTFSEASLTAGHQPATCMALKGQRSQTSISKPK